MSVQAIYPVTMSTDPARTAAFYGELLDLVPSFTSDWYVSLATTDGQAQIATVQRDHPSVPPGFRKAPAGALVTIETDDATSARVQAGKMGASVELELRDEAWGQRHFIVTDPDGMLVDVVEPIPPDAHYAALYADGADA